MRPEPFRRRLDSYPVHSRMQTRFGDLDLLGHINNVAIAQFYEEARIALNRKAFAGLAAPPPRILVANVDIAYLAEALYPGELEMGSAVEAIGRSSYVVANALFQSGRCVGAADTVLVATEGGQPAPLPEPLRESLARLRFPEGLLRDG